MNKNLTDRQQCPTMTCDCCGKEFDRRVARVVDESFSHKSINHYVCPACFSKIQHLDNRGLMGWYLLRWWIWSQKIPGIITMKYEYGKKPKLRGE